VPENQNPLEKPPNKFPLVKSQVMRSTIIKLHRINKAVKINISGVFK
jgi:hypothetical protein